MFRSQSGQSDQSDTENLWCCQARQLRHVPEDSWRVAAYGRLLYVQEVKQLVPEAVKCQKWTRGA